MGAREGKPRADATPRAKPRSTLNPGSSPEHEYQQNHDEHQKESSPGDVGARRKRIDPAGELLHLVVGERVRALGGRGGPDAEHGELLLHVGAREEALQLAALGLALGGERLVDADQACLGRRRVRQRDEAHHEKAADETHEDCFHRKSPQCLLSIMKMNNSRISMTASAPSVATPPAGRVSIRPASCSASSSVSAFTRSLAAVTSTPSAASCLCTSARDMKLCTLPRCASTLPIACPVPIMPACVCAEYGSTMVLTTRS